MASPSGNLSAVVLWDTLTGFHERPGRYAVARREPTLLFDRPLDVLLLAADRAVPGLAGVPPPEAARRSARFFVRTAMLRPGGSHYDVLGVTPQGDLAALREHYRLLIRLTHPDFAREDEPWPDDAAARVNRAYDVLSSPVKRAEYDAQRPSLAPPAPTVAVRAMPPRRKLPVSPRPSRRRRGAYASGALAVGALAALAMMWSSAEDESLKAASAMATPLLNMTEAAGASTGVAGGSWPPGGAVSSVMSRSPAGGVAPRPGAQGSRLPREARLAAGDSARAPSAPPAPPPVSRGEPVLPIPAVAAPPDSPPTGERLAASVTPAGESAALQRVVEDRPVAALERSLPGPDIRTYQPVLSDLLHMLESGQSERVQTWAARATQQDGSAQRFATAYRKLLDDAVVTGLGPVRFDLTQVQDRQVVRGWVQIRMLDRDQRLTVRDFRLRAHFVSRSNVPQLASLDAE